MLISPGVVGIDSSVLQLMTGEGTPLPVNEAILLLSPPGQGVEPLDRAQRWELTATGTSTTRRCHPSDAGICGSRR
ncbi:MAG: hypothetical protein JOY90_26740 [Bradyrhizobium sp.]|uniref:hypothetical protein n=1 Tax=Bradyrhizobium sp. TaxID=376 RepID=UPI001D26A1BF|nr:hypothetical protein [Bradyrhizobium sp.]MBV9564014.1 hypothetical protein [Bradyrhizobium sp.]